MGIDGGPEVDPLILGLLDDRRPGAGGSPDARQGSLLSEAGFILEEEAECLVGMPLLEVVGKKGELALKRSMAAGSFLGWRGRGRRQLKFNRFSRS